MTCFVPSCQSDKLHGENFCAPHLRAAEAWLKEESRLDEIAMQGLGAHVSTEDWADWDWDNPFSTKPGEFGDVRRAEAINVGAAVTFDDLIDDDDDDELRDFHAVDL